MRATAKKVILILILGLFLPSVAGASAAGACCHGIRIPGGSGASGAGCCCPEGSCPGEIQKDISAHGDYLTATAPAPYPLALYLILPASGLDDTARGLRAPSLCPEHQARAPSRPVYLTNTSLLR